MEMLVRPFKLSVFKRKYNLSLKETRFLHNRGIIEIYQGGYKGHSLCHAKKVRILNPELFKCYLGPTTVEALEFNDYEMSDACVAGNLNKEELFHQQQVKCEFARQRKKLKPRQKKNNWMPGYCPATILEVNRWANS